MKQGSCFVVLLGLFCAAASAQSSLVSTPYQLGIFVGGVLPEDLRGLSPAPAGRINLGIPLRPGAYVDASVFGFHSAGEGNNSNETSLGAGLDLRLERLDQRFSYLFLFGGGYSRAKQSQRVINAPYVDVGWGVGYELSPKLSLRSELRGMARFDKSFIAGRGVTYDALATVGLVFNLGEAPRVEQRSAPTAPPVVAPPPIAPAASMRFPLVMPALPHSQVVPRVYSADDPCPKAPPDTQVDAEGCLEVQHFILPRSVFFSSLASNTVLTDGDAALAAVVVSLLKHPELYAEINVHTDTDGYADDNLNATTAQAAALSSRLYQLGAVAGRFTATGIGEERPRANEINDSAKARNQRIDIRITHR